MFPDMEEEDEDLKSLVSWWAPGYSHSKGGSPIMAVTKKKAPASKKGVQKKKPSTKNK
jgi:hypothetical protein